MAIIGKRFCPNCGSEDVDLVAGGIMGTYMCKDCGYTGAFPEKPLLGKESPDGKIEAHLDEIRKEINTKQKTRRKRK